MKVYVLTETQIENDSLKRQCVIDVLLTQERAEKVKRFYQKLVKDYNGLPTTYCYDIEEFDAT